MFKCAGCSILDPPPPHPLQGRTLDVFLPPVQQTPPRRPLSLLQGSTLNPKAQKLPLSTASWLLDAFITQLLLETLSFMFADGWGAVKLDCHAHHALNNTRVEGGGGGSQGADPLVALGHERGRGIEPQPGRADDKEGVGGPVGQQKCRDM